MTHDTAIKVLQELKPLVSAEDKKKAIDSLGVSRVTLIRYLNGRARKIDTAAKLIGFLKNRIEERQKLIA